MLFAFIFALLSATSGALSAREPYRPAVRQVVDSIVVDRLVKAVPHRIPFIKQRSFGRGGALTVIVSKLQGIGFFQLTDATVATACRRGTDEVNRLSIRAHDEAGWHVIVVPDGCTAASPDLNEQLTALRSLAWDVLAGHIGRSRSGSW